MTSFLSEFVDDAIIRLNQSLPGCRSYIFVVANCAIRSGFLILKSRPASSKFVKPPRSWKTNQPGQMRSQSFYTMKCQQSYQGQMCNQIVPFQVYKLQTTETLLIGSNMWQVATEPRPQANSNHIIPTTSHRNNTRNNSQTATATTKILTKTPYLISEFGVHYRGTGTGRNKMDTHYLRDGVLVQWQLAQWRTWYEGRP